MICKKVLLPAKTINFIIRTVIAYNATLAAEESHLFSETTRLRKEKKPRLTWGVALRTHKVVF